MRIETINSTTWWKTRDAKTSTVERIYNLNPDQFWEVSRDIYWEIAISDTNSLSDIYSVEIQLGGDSQFGVRYDITDGLCSSLGLNIDTDKTSCSHSMSDDEIILTVRIYSNWDIDMSNYDEGMVEIIIVDLDGQSVSNLRTCGFILRNSTLRLNKSSIQQEWYREKSPTIQLLKPQM